MGEKQNTIYEKDRAIGLFLLPKIRAHDVQWTSALRRPKEVLESHYKTLVRYINFEDKGMVLGYGCGSPGMTKRSRYPEDAYRLGRSL